MTRAAQNRTCSVTALKLLGDYWALRIIDVLRHDELRFRELERSLGDINTVTLTSRLKTLCQASLIVRSEETIDRQSVTYRLSPMGLDLLPVLGEIQRFSSKYLD